MGCQCLGDEAVFLGKLFHRDQDVMGAQIKVQKEMANKKSITKWKKINFNAELMTGNTKRNTINSRERTNEGPGMQRESNYYYGKVHGIMEGNLSHRQKKREIQGYQKGGG